jgi:hypothetical protein
MFLPPKFIGGVFMRSCSPGQPSGPEKTMYRINERPTKFGNDAISHDAPPTFPLHRPRNCPCTRYRLSKREFSPRLCHRRVDRLRRANAPSWTSGAHVSIRAVDQESTAPLLRRKFKIAGNAIGQQLAIN